MRRSRLKAHLYALRRPSPFPGCGGTAPPMDLPPLLAGAALPPAAEAEIERLRQRKADAIETDLVDRSAVLETFPTGDAANAGA